MELRCSWFYWFLEEKNKLPEIFEKNIYTYINYLIFIYLIICLEFCDNTYCFKFLDKTS